MKYNTIIIGGGLAGLTAGATLSKFGKKVLLLEQHYKPGGCATTFKRGDFIIEVGLHEMSGHAKGGTIENLFNMLDVYDQLKFLKVPEFYVVHSDQEPFVFPDGYENATKALLDKYPEDEKGIKRFFKVLKGIRTEQTKLPRNPLMRKLVYPLMPLLFPNIVEATKYTVGEWLDKYFSNENAKLDITANIAYWSDDPYKLSMFYFATPFSGFIESGGRFIQGGSQRLSSYLADYINKNGGTVLLGKKADKIITKNGKATAVRFRDNFNEHMETETISCDNVIAGCAIPLVPDMLEEPHTSHLKKKITGKVDSCSLLSIYLGFTKDVKEFGVKHYSNYFRGDGITSLKDIKANNLGDWSKRSFIYVDYGQIDSRLAPRGKSAGAICAVDYIDQWEGLNDEEYKEKKDYLAKVILQRLDNKFPGIKDSIEYCEVSTPKTIKRYTSNPSGAVYGYAQTKEQTATKRFRNNFFIPNLYFASAWAFPGGGFEGTVTGGFLTALQMNKDKIWSTCDNVKFDDQRVIKLLDHKEIDDKTLELSFVKPKDFIHDNGAYAILNLLEPLETELDLPYRWLQVGSNGKEDQIQFKIKKDKSGFSKGCESLSIGDEALLFGVMNH